MILFNYDILQDHLISEITYYQGLMYSFFFGILGVALICTSISAGKHEKSFWNDVERGNNLGYRWSNIIYQLSISNPYLATEECAIENGIPPQCIPAFKGYIKGMEINHLPPNCILTLVNAFPEIQRGKSITKLKEKCLDNHGKRLFRESKFLPTYDIC